MAIDSKYSDLIQADIDGEISAEEKAELDAFLADSEEGRVLHCDFAALATSLDEIGELEPPAHIKHIIMNMAPTKSVSAKAPFSFRRMIEIPALGYVATFATGVLLALALVNSGQISTAAFDDMTGLVGTIADIENIVPVHGTVAIDESEVAGTVTLRSTGPILVLDFDLTALETVQIMVRYLDHTIWFNGFAQLESSGTSIVAGDGTVRLEMHGRHRYAVFLNNPGKRQTRIEMEFLSHGELIHEAYLEFSQ
jgi:hypothetical protein